MAIGTTEYGDISQRTAAWVATEMLSHAEPITVLAKFGMTKPIPKNTADNALFRRPIPFAAATVPLAEGVSPSPKQMAYENVAVALEQYGDVVEITDKVQDMSEDPVLKDASMLCGEQAAETIEMLTWGVLKGGTAVQYANGTQRDAVNTVIDVNDVRAVTRVLKRNRGRPITSMLASSPNYATKGIEGGYVAVGHTDLEADLRQVTGYKAVADYGQRQVLCPEEVGSVENIRFILSPLLEPWENAGGAKGTMKSTGGTYADVYPVIVIAKEAYGLCPLKGATAIKPMVLQPGIPRGGDALGQRGSVGWKSYFAACRLSEVWMVRIECAVTAI